MTNTEKFIEAYKKHTRTITVNKTDTVALAEELGYTPHSVRTLIARYKKKGLIKDDRL